VISVGKGKTMSNDHCRCVMLAGLGLFFIFSSACVHSDQAHGAADAAQAKGDATKADVAAKSDGTGGTAGGSGQPTGGVGSGAAGGGSGGNAGLDAAAVGGADAAPDLPWGTGGRFDANRDAVGGSGGNATGGTTGGNGGKDAGSGGDAPLGTGDTARDGSTVGNDGSGSGDVANRDARAEAPLASSHNIGMNLEGLYYWMGYAPYVDMAYVLCANDEKVCFDSDSGAVLVDGKGYPTSSNAHTATWAPYPDGDYSVTWDGAADGSTAISINGMSDAGMTLSAVSHSGSSYTATLHYAKSAPDQGGHLVLDVPPGVSNLHIIAPSSLYDAGHMYLREFLRRLQPFSTLRFMDLLRTNGSMVSKWSDRAFPNEFSHARSAGVVYEDIIALANESGKDVWFNIPVLATDDYICRLARLFKYGETGDKSDAPCNPSAPANAPVGALAINPSSHIYLEYSNELWNYGFSNAHQLFCMTNGFADYGTCTDYLPSADTSPRSAFLKQELAKSSYPWLETYEKAANAHGVMLVNISRIFAQVFSDRPDQIRVVADSQCAGSAYAILDMIKGAYGANALKQHLYAVAVAPYVDVQSDSDIHRSLLGIDAKNPPTNLDLSSIFNSMNSYIWTTDTTKASIFQWIRNNVQEANSYGLPVITYEGGPGLNANQNANTGGAKRLAQSDPRMRQVIFDLLSVWDEFAGADHLFTYYAMTGIDGDFGYWGAMQLSTQAGSTKWDALMSLTRPAGDATLDGIVDAVDCTVVHSNFGASGTFYWEDGDFNHDGLVNAADLDLMNANIAGAACLAP
jgi:hypothetical protein